MNGSEQKIRVMIVDDSAVARGMLTTALTQSSQIEVVASAMHGKAALQLLEYIAVDVILLDSEMPEMDGFTALPLLLKASPQSKVIMLSTLTSRGAEASFKALALGAVDCIGKPNNRGDKAILEHYFHEVTDKVIALGSEGNKSKLRSAPVATAKVKNFVPATQRLFAPSAVIQCLAIGSSTGGPQALIKLFTLLKGKPVRVPIFLTQHMPAHFTKILANHLAGASSLPCIEASNGLMVQPGHIYIAAGDYHLIPRTEKAGITLTLTQDPPINFCRPAVDPMFEALANIYGSHLLAVVLTGMGQDGVAGARAIAAKGGNVIVQDEASSVVWGMPGAVAKAGLAKAVLPLHEIAATLARVLP